MTNNFKAIIKAFSNKSKTNYITIPKVIKKSLNIKEKDEIEIIIKKVEIKKTLYKCLKCGTKSISYSDDIFCKSCGSDNVEIITDDEEEILNWEMKE